MKLNYLFAAFLVASAAVACKSSDPSSDSKIEVTGSALSENVLTVSAAASDYTLSVKSNVAYTISADQAWVSFTPSHVDNADGKETVTSVRVSVEANTANTDRSATVKVVSDANSSVSYSFKVSQSATSVQPKLEVTTIDLKPITSPVSLSGAGASASVMVVSTVSWTASSSASWLTVEPASATVKDLVETPTTVALKAEANTSSSAREATVTFKGEGLDAVTLSVKQSATTTISIDVSDITAVTANCSFTPSDDNVYYFPTIGTKETVDKYSDAQLAQANIEYFRQKYGSTYSQYDFSSFEELFLKGLCKQGKYSETIEDLDVATDYVAYAFAVDENLNLISAVARKGFTTENAQASEDYNKWLGKWTMPAHFTTADKRDSLATEKVTVATKVPGVSYSVTFESVSKIGLPSIVTQYSETDKTMTFVSIDSLVTSGNYTFGFYSECYYAGGNGYEAGNYVITGDGYPMYKMTLDASGNSATGEAQSVSVNSLGTLKTVDMTYFGLTANGSIYTFRDIPMFEFPAPMTKVTSSSAASMQNGLTLRNGLDIKSGSEFIGKHFPVSGVASSTGRR